jgi:hypothetical protein
MQKIKTYKSAEYRQPKLWNITFNFQYLDDSNIVLIDKDFTIEYSKPSEEDMANAPEGFILGSPESVMAELEEKIDKTISEYTEIESQKIVIADEFNNLLK